MNSLKDTFVHFRMSDEAREKEIDDITRELEALRIHRVVLIDRLARVRGSQTEAEAERPFAPGDRVSVVNRVRGGPNGWSQANQTGTVTRLTATRVYLTTDSNLPIYRSFGNVIKISDVGIPTRRR